MTIVTEMRYRTVSPASGAPKGLLVAKNAEKGRTPSRPSSWITVMQACEG
jgi:hypothetical protein